MKHEIKLESDNKECRQGCDALLEWLLNLTMIRFTVDRISMQRIQHAKTLAKALNRNVQSEERSPYITNTYSAGKRTTSVTLGKIHFQTISQAEASIFTKRNTVS